MPPPCCEAAENKSPRNCWSALLTELADVALVVPLVEAVELESLLVDDAVELLDALTPIWANAAAIAAASGFVLVAVLDVESLESDWDSYRLALSICQI